MAQLLVDPPASPESVDREPIDPIDESVDRVAPANCINAWCNTTDAGSDEVYAKRMKGLYAKDLMAHWEFNADCLAHQFQLMVFSLLAFLTWVLKSLGKDYKYWSALAKVLHCWRDKMTDVFSVMCGVFSAKEAIDAGANKVPPQPLVGRWGVVFECMQRLIRFEFDRMLKVLLNLASSGAKRRKTASSTVDDISTEEYKEHTEKMSRWKKAACEALADWQFQFCTLMGERLIGALQHFFASVLRLPDRAQGECGHLSLARLVCGGAHKIMETDMVPLLQAAAWDDIVAMVPIEWRSRCSYFQIIIIIIRRS